MNAVQHSFDKVVVPNADPALHEFHFYPGAMRLHANQLQIICHGIAHAMGWWTDLETGQPKKPNVGELLMLCVSELAEAMEGHRKNLMDDKLPHRKMVEVELADCVIRCFDMAGGLGLDLGAAIAEKLVFNTQREDHQIAARQGEHGKKF